MKLVVVSGGTRGLGLAITTKLVADGYKVVVIGRTETPELSQLMCAHPDQVFYEYFDFEQIKDIHKLVKDNIIAKYGRPWGLVNNAAIGTDGVLATLHETDIGRLLKVNVEAPILLTKYLMRSMLINRKGRVINVSSIIASTGFSGLSVYGATKAAMIGFTKSLAREVGKSGIAVNAIAPGYMQTDMTQSLQGDKLESVRRRSALGDLAAVADVANAVSFLLNEQTGSITGTVITVDSGSTA